MSDSKRELDITVTILEKKIESQLYQCYENIDILQQRNDCLLDKIVLLERRLQEFETLNQQNMKDIHSHFNKISETLKYLENLCLFMFQSISVSIFCTLGIAKKFWANCCSEFQTFSFFTLPDEFKRYKNLKQFFHDVFDNRRCCFTVSKVYDWDELCGPDMDSQKKKRKIVNSEENSQGENK